MSEALPREFGRYRLLGLLGTGGMARVYRAESLPVAGIKRRVAIKVIRSDSSDRELRSLLLDEARVWVRLQHPNVVGVVDFGEQDGEWFLALELVDGVTAADLVRETGPLPPKEALCIAERVAKALAHAHALREEGRPLSIVHRDVKPANILLSARGEVKLTDFGIARATDRVSQTAAGMVRGSVHYMSPEQARGESLDGRSDLFSLGSTIHWLVTGSLLFDQSAETAFLSIADGKVPGLSPSLPPAMRDLISSLTAADRRKRPASAAEVAKQVRAMLVPFTAEDQEPLLAARVAAARGEKVGPENEATLRVSSPMATTQASPRATETVPAPSSGAAGRLTRAFLRGPWVFMSVAAVAAFAFGIVLAGQSRSCSAAERRLARLRLSDGPIAEMHDAVVAMSRSCASTPELRAKLALSARRAGVSSSEAERSLGDSDVERRVRELLRLDAAGWPGDATLPAWPVRDDEDLCFEKIVEFNLRGGLQAWIVGSVHPCADVLAGSSWLAARERIGKVQPVTGLDIREEKAKDFFPRIASRVAGPLLRAAVESRRDAPSVEVIEQSLDVARAHPGDDETISGIWVPSSWRPLPGESGRLSTALDDVGALAALIRGDREARAGRYDDAVRVYRVALARGLRPDDFAVRLFDVAVETRDVKGMNIALAHTASLTKASPPLVARAIVLQLMQGNADAAALRLKRARGRLPPLTHAHLASRVRAVAKPEARDWRHIELDKGRALLDREDAAAARRVFETILRRDPLFADAHLMLAVALFVEGLDGDACRHMERYLALAPDGSQEAAEARWMLASCR